MWNLVDCSAATEAFFCIAQKKQNSSRLQMWRDTLLVYDIFVGWIKINCLGWQRLLTAVFSCNPICVLLAKD